MRSERAPTRARKSAACADGKGNANGVTSSTSPGALPALARIDPRLLRAAAVGGLLGGLGMFFPGAGSVITAVATDAPLLPHQCQALARRVTLGLARTGTTGSHFSGDLFLAFSTANPGAFTPGFATLYRGAVGGNGQLFFIPWGFLDPFYEAVVQGWRRPSRTPSWQTRRWSGGAVTAPQHCLGIRSPSSWAKGAPSTRREGGFVFRGMARN